MSIQQIAVDQGGRVVALKRSGEIRRQVAAQGSQPFPSEWVAVPLDGLPGRVAQVAVRFDGSLVAITAGTGQIFESYLVRQEVRWRPISET
jgi:hypothetical protein